MQLQVTHCVKCGVELGHGGRGRPSRFCSDGCNTSAEAEMRRLNTNLRKFEERRAGRFGSRQYREELAESIGELQARYDHLAGVPDA